MTVKNHFQYLPNAITHFRDEFDWLSNFYPVKMIYDGLEFANSESAYQSRKCANPDQRILFGNLSASSAKKLGRKIHMISGWNNIRTSAMYSVLIAKFSIPELRDKLLKTGDRQLVETNTWNDRFWGVCRSVGENKLGEILMQVREYYRTGF